MFRLEVSGISECFQFADLPTAPEQPSPLARRAVALVYFVGRYQHSADTLGRTSDSATGSAGPVCHAVSAAHIFIVRVLALFRPRPIGKLAGSRRELRL